MTSKLATVCSVSININKNILVVLCKLTVDFYSKCLVDDIW